MTIAVELSRRALRHLRELNRYIAKAASPEVAEEYVERILMRCYELGDLPKRGRPRPDLGRRLRSIPFERCQTIIYRLRRDGVEIIAVVNRGQDNKGALRRR